MVARGIGLATDVFDALACDTNACDAIGAPPVGPFATSPAIVEFPLAGTLAAGTLLEDGSLAMSINSPVPLTPPRRHDLNLAEDSATEFDRMLAHRR